MRLNVSRRYQSADVLGVGCWVLGVLFCAVSKRTDFLMQSSRRAPSPEDPAG